jgi:predicted Zn-dependent protease with MMP-like domain/lipopolysaccharide biosynthesis regulator YciM
MNETNAHSLLDRAWELLSRGEDEAAEKVVQEVLTLFPEHPEGLHLMAELSLHRENPVDAIKFTERALKSDAAYFPSYLMRVNIALFQEDLPKARKLTEEALVHAQTPDDAFEARMMLVDLLLEDANHKAAQKQVIEAFKNPPQEPELIAQLAEALLEVCGDAFRATQLVEPAIKKHPTQPDLHYALGRAYQEIEDPRYIEEFLVVHSLEENLSSPAFGLSAEEFLQEAENAYTQLPEVIRDKLEGVAILIEDRPSRSMVEQGTDPRIMGIFDGPVHHHGKNGHASPTRIVLFQKNIEVVCRSREQILEEIETTLLHEIGHYLGLDEDDLIDRGLN